MPTTPTTKSQVQAYRFVLRRMQSALVRKDAVMLHDPMRTHSRATIVGICLAAVGLVGFLVWGLLSPAPSLPDNGGVVIAEPSGQIYVAIGQGSNKKLIPTFNLASARLLLMAQQQGSSAGAPAAAPSTGGPLGGPPTVVKDDQLKDVRKDRLRGIPYGPTLLPSNDSQRVSNDWAVCDDTKIDPTRPDPTKDSVIETTVLAGSNSASLGPELAPNEALLVTAKNNKTYLVYRTPTSVNQRNSSVVRAEIDLEDRRAVSAFSLSTVKPRKISTGLLNAIPEVKKLAPPDIDGANSKSQVDVDGLRVGTVFSIEVAGRDTKDYYVVMNDGIEKVKRSTANLIRFTYGGGAEIRQVSPDQITNMKQVGQIDDESFPDAVPEVLDPATGKSTVACVGWTARITGDMAESNTTLHIGATVPQQDNRVKISTPNPDGERIDFFHMTPGRAAVVRGATDVREPVPQGNFTNGPIYLISDLGVKFGVPDQTTAAALGLDNQRPAPDSIIRLLPNGASLNAKDAMQSYDTVPLTPGQFDSKPQSAAGSGGSGGTGGN